MNWVLQDPQGPVWGSRDSNGQEVEGSLGEWIDLHLENLQQSGSLLGGEDREYHVDQETAPRAASCCCCCCGCWIIGVIDLKHFFLHNNLQHVASIWRWTLFWNKSFFSSANSPIKFKDNPIIFCNQKILLKPTQYLFLFYPALSCFNRWSQNGLPSPTFPFFFANSFIFPSYLTPYPCFYLMFLATGG